MYILDCKRKLKFNFEVRFPSNWNKAAVEVVLKILLLCCQWSVIIIIIFVCNFIHSFYNLNYLHLNKRGISVWPMVPQVYEGIRNEKATKTLKVMCQMFPIWFELAARNVNHSPDSFILGEGSWLVVWSMYYWLGWIATNRIARNANQAFNLYYNLYQICACMVQFPLWFNSQYVTLCNARGCIV